MEYGIYTYLSGNQHPVRKIIAVLLLSCLLIATAGHYLAFRVQLYRLKAEMKRSLRQGRHRKEVLVLCLDAEQARQLRWEDEEEFSWQGEMYDVIEKRVNGSSLRIACIADKKEERLLQAYQQSAEKRGGWGRGLLVKLITTDFIYTSIELPATPQRKVAHRFPDFAAGLVFRPLAVAAAPPRGC